MALLEVANLHSGYGKLPVLHGVNFSVGAGELAAVFGPNGAGKSTMAKSVFGRLTLSAGKITYDGQLLNAIPTERLNGLGLAYVPQESNGFPTLSVDDNLRVGLAGRRGVQLKPALERAYDMFPALGGRRGQRASTLSGGERQMLALASAVVLEPEFLLVDEPTSGLAPIIVDGLIEKTLEIAGTGTTILWIVGDDAMKILPHADRSYLMQSGVIAGEWTKNETLKESELAELFFGAGRAP